VNTVLPLKVRKIVYVVFVLAGIASGALPLAFQAAGHATPVWYKVGSAVLQFVVTAPAALALFNLSPDQAAGLAAEIPAAVAVPTPKRAQVTDPEPVATVTVPAPTSPATAADPETLAVDDSNIVESD